MRDKFAFGRGDLAQLARGFLMGGADIIPGVSGGTVALILGIYNRLVRAISNFDTTLIDHVRRGRWSSAAEHMDLRFLLTLGCGIAGGVLSLASLMHYLLEKQQTPTYAVFFGLILASSFLVARLVERWTFPVFFGFVAAACAAFLLVSLPALDSPPSGNLYVFTCGLVAICAMILPGVSGSFILLVLGKYQDITGLLRGLLHGDIHVAAILTLSIFSLGCLIGLLSFSKLLRWLLRRYETPTMALLCGLMVGSLKRIWPFGSAWPPSFDRHFALVVTLSVAGFAFVLLLDYFSNRLRNMPPGDELSS